MARFLFLVPGPPMIRGPRVRIGSVTEIRVPLQDGGVLVFRPRATGSGPGQGFQSREPLEGGARHRLRHAGDPPGGKLVALEDFDEDRPGRGRVARDITDLRALRYLRADPRFTETP